jgi:hypothetical protein
VMSSGLSGCYKHDGVNHGYAIGAKISFHTGRSRPGGGTPLLFNTVPVDIINLSLELLALEMSEVRLRLRIVSFRP